MKLLIATNNQHKVSEILQLIPQGIKLITLSQAGITEDIPETGLTLKENAMIKARYAYNRTKINCFADDTGLEVETLDGAPGVYSARYAGAEQNSEKNIQLLLQNMKDSANRKACFKTVIALIIDGEQYFFEGITRGQITEKKSGSDGFGYDPVFVPEGQNLTFAQMTLPSKNKISHRGKAIYQLTEFLKPFYCNKNI